MRLNVHIGKVLRLIRILSVKVVPFPAYQKHSPHPLLGGRYTLVRGEQPISLGKLLQACEFYHIPLEDVVKLEYQETDCQPLRSKITALLDECDHHQLEVIQKFISEIALTL